MKDAYTFAKRADHVSIDLPIDFLTFLRFFGFDKLAQKVAGQGMDDSISYQNLHEVKDLTRYSWKWVWFLLMEIWEPGHMIWFKEWIQWKFTQTWMMMPIYNLELSMVGKHSKAHV